MAPAPARLAAATTGAGAATGAAAGAAAGAGDIAAAVAWLAAQLANFSALTVNTRNRMFACDDPQYSVQNPLNTCSVSDESGVYQSQFVRFVIRSRLPPSCGVQNECRTSRVLSWKFTVRPAGMYSSFAVTMPCCG